MNLNVHDCNLRFLPLRRKEPVPVNMTQLLEALHGFFQVNVGSSVSQSKNVQDAKAISANRSVLGLVRVEPRSVSTKDSRGTRTTASNWLLMPSEAG